MSTPDTRHEWVSVKQAAIHFGTSESDIRRRIKRGELISESFDRPGGTLLRVRLPTPDDAPPTEAAPAPDPRQHEPDRLQDIATGLLERLADQDATVAAKDAEIARINAQLLLETAARARAEAERDMLAEQLAREREETARLRRPWWQWW